MHVQFAWAPKEGAMRTAVRSVDALVALGCDVDWGWS